MRLLRWPLTHYELDCLDPPASNSQALGFQAGTFIMWCWGSSPGHLGKTLYEGSYVSSTFFCISNLKNLPRQWCRFNWLLPLRFNIIILKQKPCHHSKGSNSDHRQWKKASREITLLALEKQHAARREALCHGEPWVCAKGLRQREVLKDEKMRITLDVLNQ